MPGEHAIYAPSSSDRWMICTASAEAIALLGEQEEGEEAKEGTAAHEEIERCLAPKEPLPVNPEHPAAYGIGLVIDYVRQLPPGGFWIEQRVELTRDIWGRCDVAHWSDVDKVLTIVDYKNGFVNVEAEENSQLMIYAAGSIFTHNLPAKWIRLVVVQPNSFLPVPRVKQWPIGADYLYEFAKRAAAVPSGTKRFVPGEHCTYCPIFGRCPPTRDILAHLGAALSHPPEDVRPEQVALFAAMEKPISDWFKTLYKVNLKKGLAGQIAPGTKIVTSRSHRTWNNEESARAVIFERAGLDALSPPTPAQAEKIPAIGKEWVDANCASPPGGPVFALESDTRKPWASKTTAEMFGKVQAPAP